jgi:hypothetical protein
LLWPSRDHRGEPFALLTRVTLEKRIAQSQSSEVLVSRVVTDLAAGAGLKFSDRGSHELKGLPGRWDLFAASV